MPLDLPDTSTARDAIFGRIRAALDPLPERAAYPEWDAAAIVTRQQTEAVENGVSAWEAFSIRLIGVNGTPLAGLEALGQWLRQENITVASCDPRLIPLIRPHAPDLELDPVYQRARIDEYTCGITLAAGAIAETGSVILRDRETSSRLTALAPWVHVALVHPADLYLTVLEAIGQLGDDPNVVWATGPSKTADVEGILIEGVHGPGRQVVVLTEQAPRGA